jgi:hypothetical protein
MAGRRILTGVLFTLSLLPLFAQALPENVFVKITDGPLVTDQEGHLGFGWADYDGDGWLDLLVANADRSSNPQVRNSLYRNQGDGTFVRVTDGPLVNKPGSHADAVWGDYDNDGYPDVFLPNADYQNISANLGIATQDAGDSYGAALVDFDNDGWCDLFVINRGSTDDWNTGQNDCLYRNNRDGTFTKMTATEVGEIVQDYDPGQTCVWSDFDGDGWVDLLRARLTPGIASAVFLYLNGGNSGFRKINLGSLTAGEGLKFAIGDFDNDGHRDVFSGGLFSPYELHRNVQGETFVDVSVAAGLDPVSQNWSQSGTWGDFDNDGDIDLFAANYQKTNTLYQNIGDGTFVSLDAGSPLLDGNNDIDAAWIDFDNDGFLDLFLASGNGDAELNYLYRNNRPTEGNVNRWLKIRLQGTASNRSGIGAKVRAQAVIRGQTVRQLRELACAGATAGGQQGLELHFGLGDATKVVLLRIEWPSGIVQELKDVPANQILTVTEPPRLIPQGAGSFQIQCWINQRFDVEASTDLAAWSNVATVTNLTGTLVFEDVEAEQHEHRYYRVLAR